MLCGEVLAAYMFMGAALCMHLISVAHRLMGWDGKTRMVLFVYVSVGIVSAHDIGSPCSVCCVPCARYDGWLNVSACCAPSLFDGCEAQLVACNDDNPAASFCKEMLDSPRHVLLDGFWSAAGAMLAFGGCCILFYVAKLMACTGLAKRSKPGQEASESRKKLVILRSLAGGVVLRWPACNSAGRWECEVLQSSVSSPQCACHPWFGDDQHPGGLVCRF